MSQNYRCLFHKIIFRFFIPRIFPFVFGQFFPSCLDWSGNYSNYAEYTIQPLDRLDLKFSHFCHTLFDLQRSSELPQKVQHHGLNKRRWLKQPQIILTNHFLPKVTIFHCFDVCSVRPPQIFQVQAKISTVRPMLPDYLSVSYDYGCSKFQVFYY